MPDVCLSFRLFWTFRRSIRRCHAIADQAEAVAVGLFAGQIVMLPGALLTVANHWQCAWLPRFNWLLRRSIGTLPQKRWFPVSEGKLENRHRAYHRFGRWSPTAQLGADHWRPTYRASRRHRDLFGASWFKSGVTLAKACRYFVAGSADAGFAVGL